MIKNVKLANRVILAIAVVLGVAGITVIAIDWASGSTSMLLELVRQILFVLIFVTILVRSIVNKESASTRYLILAVIIIWLIFLAVAVVHHPTRQWP
jgi:cytochrome bd-type quinol oxidase subunit 2